MYQRDIAVLATTDPCPTDIQVNYMTNHLKRYLSFLPGWKFASHWRWRYINSIGQVPSGFAARRLIALRWSLQGIINIHCIAEHKSGAKYPLESDPVDDMILRGLYGQYQSLFFPVRAEDVPPESLVLDVGSHHGFYALTTLMRYHSVQLIAVEPDPSSMARLRRNLKRNDLLDRVELVEAAIAEEDGCSPLLRSDEGSWGNRLIPCRCDARKSISVRTMQLDKILCGRDPFIVKSNCEGGEFALIPQLFSLGCRPKFIILLVHPDEGDEQQLLKLIQSKGYLIKPVATSSTHPRYVCEATQANQSYSQLV